MCGVWAPDGPGIAMGYNARNDEIRGNVTCMRREWEAQRGAGKFRHRIAAHHSNTCG